MGFDLSLAEEVCKRRGWEFVKRPIAWDSKDSELETGAISCIWNGFTMNGRETEYTWSTPYVDNSQVVVVRTDSGIESLSDLAGKILVVQSDSAALAALEGDDATEENKALAKSLKNLQQVADYNSAFMNLESGMVDAIAMDIGVASYQLESRNGEFKLLDQHISSEQYGIGFKLGDTELRDQVQVTLFEMLSDGTFAKIAEEWGLTDSVCLSTGDTKYIDGGSVPVTDADIANVQSESVSDGTLKAVKLDFVGVMKQLISGLGSTFLIFVLTLLFSMPLGLLLAAVRMSKIKVLQWIAKIYISIMRGTPLMLQLLVVFFSPYYLFNVQTSYSYRFYAVIIGFSLNNRIFS